MIKIWDPRVVALLNDPNRKVKRGTMPAYGLASDWFAAWARLNKETL